MKLNKGACIFGALYQCFLVLAHVFQMTLVGSESLSVVAGSTDKSTVQSTQTDHTALLQQAGVAAFTLGDQGQQVYVITDPAQLEALQVIVV